MVSRVLVSPDISGGADLLAELQREGLPVTAAFWRYPSESRDLSLVIASPTVDEQGSLPVYEQIQAALERLPQIHLLLDDITAVKDRDPLVAKLRTLTPSQLDNGRTFRVSFSTFTPGYDASETVYVYFAKPTAADTNGDSNSNR